MSDKVTICCDGGCGRSVTPRKERISLADFSLCNSRADGDRCRASLPARLPGMIAVVEFNAAASCSGITYKAPNAEERAALARAKRLERFARGVTDRAELQSIRGGKP